MLKKIVLIFACLGLSCDLSANLINDMQGCQALLEFVDTKLVEAPKHYAKKDVQLVRKALNAYNAFIQKEIVSPGLLQFNGGDKTKADAMQAQVDAYKKQLFSAYANKYTQPGLKTDFAISVNECAKKAVPEGNDLGLLKQALPLMIKLAKT